MRIAYLVLAHKDPQLLKRTVETLSCGDCAFFIHVDQKSDLGDFAEIRGHNVFFSHKRLPVYWAGFSIVDATLVLLRQAMGASQKFDYVVLLSGSDYPLRSRGYIHKFLDKSHGLEFISMVQIPNETYGMPLSKLNRIWYEPDKPVRRLATRALAKVGLAQRDYRKHLGSLVPYGGSQWWTLTREACHYILAFISSNGHVEKLFRTAPTSDETFFHTILGNSPFRSRARRSLTYADWSAGPNHPTTISEKHLALFEAQGWVWDDDIWGSGEALFARKFSGMDFGLLERTDAMIKRKEEYSPCP